MTECRSLSKQIEACLPVQVIHALGELEEKQHIGVGEINEIRLRSHGCVSATYMAQNLILDCTITQEELFECVSRLCRGSIYAHASTMRNGYITIEGNVRVGICGKLAADGRALGEVTSLSIRIPHAVFGVCGALLGHFERCGLMSTLIYSPPGGGKTTLLRDLCAKLGRERRVAVIDTRGELGDEKKFAHTMCDVLTGYSRAEGIEIATRTLSPEVIICDEIGGEAEARQILSAANAGVPIVASAHAKSVGELMARPNIRLLHDAHAFSHYVGIEREKINGRLTRSFLFDFVAWEDAL